jgi:hypothetical protein
LHKKSITMRRVTKGSLRDGGYPDTEPLAVASGIKAQVFRVFSCGFVDHLPRQGNKNDPRNHTKRLGQNSLVSVLWLADLLRIGSAGDCLG